MILREPLVADLAFQELSAFFTVSSGFDDVPLAFEAVMCSFTVDAVVVIDRQHV